MDPMILIMCTGKPIIGWSAGKSVSNGGDFEIPGFAWEIVSEI